MAYFKTVDVADLEAASGYFDGDFSMEELELMHIQFLSDVGNWGLILFFVVGAVLFCNELLHT